MESALCHDRRVNASATASSAQGGRRAARVRLDQRVVDLGMAASRTRAQALILGGKVRTGTGDGARVDRKAGDLVGLDLEISVLEADPFVSRGGHKLTAALDAFGIDPAGAVALDAGASTGGFTDVLLQRGALRVYAVDVGRGQLAESLRRDPRVKSMERTNARTLAAGSLPETVTIATIDVSFISLRLVLGPVAACFGADGGRIIALVKPQFEAGRGQVPGGVVRDPTVHRAAVERVVGVAADLGLAATGVIASPILGPEGNREFLVAFGVPGGAVGSVRPAVPVRTEIIEHIAALTPGGTA